MRLTLTQGTQARALNLGEAPSASGDLNIKNDMTDKTKSDPLAPLRHQRPGRPKGSSNKKGERHPATLGAYIEKALAKPILPPPPKQAEPDSKRHSGIWATMTPSERSEYAKKLRSKVTPEGLARSGRKLSVPNGWNYRDYEAAKSEAARDAKRMLKKLEAAGELNDDEYARFATLECLTLLRAPGSPSFKLKVARILLRYYKPKPATASQVATKVSAEEILDWFERESR